MIADLNYTGLAISITRDIDPEVVVQAILSFESRSKRGPKGRTTEELCEMRDMLTNHTYLEVAQHYGLKRGDNVYQLLKRAGMLPENRGRRRAEA